MKLGSYIYALVGVLIVVIGIFFSSWQIYRLMSQSLWQNDQRLTIAWFPKNDQSNAVYVVSYAPQRLTILKLPHQVKLKVSRQYGNYPTGSLWQLAQQENDTRLLTESLTSLISSPVNFWISNPTQCDQITSCVVKQTRTWAFSQPLTDIPRWDRFKLWFQVRQLRADQITLIDGSEGSWAQQQIAVDGVEEIVFSKDVVDARLADQFIDPIIRTQNHTISVINTIGTRGLANDISRIISGWGGLVISTSDNPTALDQCLIRTKLANDNQTASRLAEFFDCHVEVTTDISSDIELWTGKNNQIWSTLL